MVLALIVAAVIVLVARARDNAAAAGRTIEVIDALTATQLALRAAESAQRGVLLTGEPGDSALHATAAAAARDALARARALARDAPEQARALDALAGPFEAKIAEMAETLRLRAAGDEAGALALVRTNQGRALMRTVVAGLEAARAAEDAQLARRTGGFDALARWLMTLAIAGAVAVAALAASSVRAVRRSTVELREAAAALGASNSGLESSLAERAADLRAANEEVARFAYIVSHDLRSPLVNIMGFTSEVEAARGQVAERLAGLRAKAALSDPASADPAPDAALLADVDEAVGFIKASIGRMDRLIASILQFSREGRRPLRPEPVDVTAMAERLRAALGPQAAVTGARVEVEALPPVVETDRQALEQVLANLVGNAIKYGRPGQPPRVAVRGREEEDAVVLEVEDDGRGIAPEDRERVFELFRRAGVQDTSGEGLGLAHVRALVRRLGGTVELESEPGRGSLFRVRLPRRAAVATPGGTP